MRYRPKGGDREAVLRRLIALQSPEISMKLESTAVDFGGIGEGPRLENVVGFSVNSEEGLRLALETGNIGLWVWNVSDRSQPKQFSKRLLDILGLPHDAVVTNKRFLQCVHPDDRESVDACVQSTLSGETGGNYHAEYRIVRQNDGETRCLLANGKAFFSPDGEAYRFIGTVMDVTEQKHSEELLARQNEELEERIGKRTEDLARTNEALEEALARVRSSEAELRSLVDVIPTQVWFAGVNGGTLYQNKQWLDYVGLTQEAAREHGWQETLHPDDRQAYLDRWREIMASRSPGEAEARFRRHDGNYRWFLMRVVPVFDPRGEIIRWYGTNTDIEDRRSSEHVARGHLDAITETLSALANESNSDRLLAHVMEMITKRMHAHSVVFYEQVSLSGFVLRYSFDEGKMSSPGKEKAGIATSALLPPDHPLWGELHRDGERCLMGELAPPRLRVIGDPEAKWYPTPEGYKPSETLDRLVAEGVVAVLIVPMKIGGKLAGLLSIRSTRSCLFQPSEVRLAQALAYQAMLAYQLMNLARQSRIAAVLNERERLARNLHDTLAQGFTGVIVQLEASEDARLRGLGEEANQHVVRASLLARESLQEARRAVRALRIQALEDNNLCDALTVLLEKMTAGTSIRSSLKVVGTPCDLTEELEENLLRICQEVLTNSLRHAKAATFTAHITFGPEAIQIHLWDDGCGFDFTASTDGSGLAGIRERVELMGGSLDLSSIPGSGTSVSINVPLVP